MARLLRGAGLRELIDRGWPMLALSCSDALSARLVEEAGFPAVYMTGFGSSAGHLGRSHHQSELS